MSEREYKSFKIHNLHMNEVMTEIKVPRKKKIVAKNSWYDKIYNYENYVKTWKLWIQKVMLHHKSS